MSTRRFPAAVVEEFVQTRCHPKSLGVCALSVAVDDTMAMVEKIASSASEHHAWQARHLHSCASLPRAEARLVFIVPFSLKFAGG
jgi:hypothetical protein